MPGRRPSVSAKSAVSAISAPASRRALLAAAVALALRPATAVAAAPAAPPGPVRVTEGQVAEAAPGRAILYPSVTSCLTVTLRLCDGAKVGAHASLFQVPGELRSDQILAAARRVAGTRKVTAVEVRGAVGAWHPGYFTKAIESYAEGEAVPYPEHPDPDGLARAVAAGLGLPARVRVTVEDVPDGDQTVR
ncbi:hypothetical protein [Streptomyces griseocarneus]|uniref:hypothetical protein n=1 Tax=Streptomyces griseocarneus TaxID=51201 RepID=UPI0019939BEC|nr:hypothetical protein [Streptomyces griseocarneus]MBZ6474151.1 hypothetical protein [Streptomyces griseocarneus]GHG52337.1 hypothetical protein GCM10018779_13430 [Streptomyces griseocarneus]